MCGVEISAVGSALVGSMDEVRLNSQAASDPPSGGRPAAGMVAGLHARAIHFVVAGTMPARAVGGVGDRQNRVGRRIPGAGPQGSQASWLSVSSPNHGFSLGQRFQRAFHGRGVLGIPVPLYGAIRSAPPLTVQCSYRQKRHQSTGNQSRLVESAGSEWAIPDR